MSAWHELVVRGPEKVLRAFTAGFLAAWKEDPAAVVLFERDLGIEPSSFGERLRDLLALGHVAALFVPEALVRPLAEGITQRGPALDLVVERSRPVHAATFRLEAEVYSREIAQAIRKLLDPLPPGVRVTDVSEHEETHQDARGVELYAPMHGYTFRVAATVTGDLPAVMALRESARAIEQVDVGALRIDGPG